MKACARCGESGIRFNAKFFKPCYVLHKKEQDRAYYRVHSEKIKARTKKWNQDRPEYMRAVRRASKEKALKTEEAKEYHRQKAREAYQRKKEANPNWWKDRYANDPIFRKKVQARLAIRYAKQQGKLNPKPCEGCGSDSAEAHHPDYDKPKDIHWLCHKCHGVEHRLD